MNTIDIVIAAGFVLLLIIVALRIWLGRRVSIEDHSDIKIKRPQKRGEEPQKPVEPIQQAHESAPEQPQVFAESAVDDIRSQAEPVADSQPEIAVAKDSAESPEAPAAQFQTEDTTRSSEEVDPLILIRTFSAPTEKRLDAINIAGEQKLTEAVPALIEALYEPDSAISAAAAEALGQIGDDRAIEPLLEISRRNDAHLLKQISAQSEEKIEEDEAEVSAESSENEENPYKFKEMVIFKIDQLPKEYFQPDGSPIPRKELVVKGLKDNNQQLRQMAAKAAIGLESDEVVEPLIEALENPYEVESVRFMAAEALGGMDNDKSVESLLKSLKDENVAVRYSAAAALSGKKDDRVVFALVGAITDPDKYVRSSVAYALGTTGSKQALDALFQLTADESEVVRFSAAKSIACFSSEMVIEEIKSRLGYSKKETKLALLEVLGHIKTDESVEILRSFLREEDGELSYKASMALIGQENLEILDELIEASKRLDQELYSLMKDGRKDSVKAKFASKSFAEASEPGKAVSEKRDSSILPEYMLSLRDGLMSSNPNIRGSSANALGDAKDPRAVDILLAAIDDENEFVRASVISSLGRIAAEKSLPFILDKQEDHSEEVRYALVKALARFSHETALECLKDLANNDMSSQVKRAARAALDKK
ncbi:MAG: hypothetical protein PWR01_3604 [Clostridiales bacterium]|jgi:HEAT repeat protein|nr:hypothetical protein [Clostridiales bacterium]MDN5282531.1 hypothetical protein [Candidatus Ozemobacter sp.]